MSINVFILLSSCYTISIVANFSLSIPRKTPHVKETLSCVAAALGLVPLDQVFTVFTLDGLGSHYTGARTEHIQVVTSQQHRRISTRTRGVRVTISWSEWTQKCCETLLLFLVRRVTARLNWDGEGTHKVRVLWGGRRWGSPIWPGRGWERRNRHLGWCFRGWRVGEDARWRCDVEWWRAACTCRKQHKQQHILTLQLM